MIEKLSTLRLPVDFLLQDLARKVQPSCKSCSRNPYIKNLVTYSLVKDKEVQQLAKRYITKLLEDQEQYGYLYFLSGQSLLVPLSVRLKGELFMDQDDEILKELESIASGFAPRDTIAFDITMVELFYFYVRLVNPHLSWMAVEYMLQCVQGHAHLIASPDRRYSWKKICEASI